MPLPTLLVYLLLASLLGACGNKGPLTLPIHDTLAPQPWPVAAPPAADHNSQAIPHR